ncbi:MAG: histone deacetylase family protein [Fidelibacterota bacterium]
MRVSPVSAQASYPTGLIFSPDYLKHNPGPGHPESPSRLETIMDHIESVRLGASLKIIHPQPASRETVGLVHDDDYVDGLEGAYSRGRRVLDGGDTVISEDSFSVGLLATGGVTEAVRQISHGSVRNAFCLVRPPGHHAETGTAMGFCLFNHVAVAARYAQETFDVERIFILDWDVHHGNGTQHIFESDPSVFYVSLHQYPFYPGTGDRTETGTGPGLGTTQNFPLRAGSGDREYLDIMENSVSDTVLRFRPGLIIVSCGFDAHARDPLANMDVSTEAFKMMTKITADLAEEVCCGRLLSVLEGGYDLVALRECAEAHLAVLAGGGE